MDDRVSARCHAQFDANRSRYVELKMMTGEILVGCHAARQRCRAMRERLTVIRLRHGSLGSLIVRRRADPWWPSAN